MGPPFFGRADGGAHIAEIIQGIEDAKDLDPVLDGQADELFHHIVGVVAVPDQVLPAKEHL